MLNICKIDLSFIFYLYLYSFAIKRRYNIPTIVSNRVYGLINYS